KPIFSGIGKSRLRHPERFRTSAQFWGKSSIPFIRRNVPLEIRRNKFFPVLVFEKKNTFRRFFREKGIFERERNRKRVFYVPERKSSSSYGKTPGCRLQSGAVWKLRGAVQN
ncbi:hypothetical protein NPIL_652051, partial [Nephila pilipes]